MTVKIIKEFDDLQTRLDQEWGKINQKFISDTYKDNKNKFTGIKTQDQEKIVGVAGKDEYAKNYLKLMGKYLIELGYKLTQSYYTENDSILQNEVNKVARNQELELDEYNGGFNANRLIKKDMYFSDKYKSMGKDGLYKINLHYNIRINSSFADYGHPLDNENGKSNIVGCQVLIQSNLEKLFSGISELEEEYDNFIMEVNKILSKSEVKWDIIEDCDFIFKDDMIFIG